MKALSENHTPDTSASLEAINLDESKRLIALEATIQRGQQTFLEVAAALTEIRDGRLYRADFATFEQYCREKWHFTKTHANNLIQGAEVVRQLPSAVTTMVVNERQVRELAKVEPEERAAVLESLISSGQKITAETIRMAADEKVILQAAADIRKERGARRLQPKLPKVPVELHPINAEDRKLRVLVDRTEKLYRLVIGPNKAGLLLPTWWHQYQQSQKYQTELAEAEALEAEAKALEAAASFQQSSTRRPNRPLRLGHCRRPRLVA